MVRQTSKLSAIAVRNAKRPGLYGDGAGLYLRIGPSGAKSWVYRFKIHGKARTMGLGALHTLSLADAREAAQTARQLVLAGIDPIDDRKARADARKRESAAAMTFRDCAKRYIAAHEAAWTNAKYQAEWPSTLQRFVYPVIGDTSVADIDTPAVLRVVEPIWSDRAPTANRVRGRIEAVLDWAAARGARQGENPARWRGHLSKILPSPTKARPVRHLRALPYQQAPAFIADVRTRDGLAYRALEFVALTVVRVGEAVGATWTEIDLEAKTWTIPAQRMKSRREHRVPLSEPAIGILEALPRIEGSHHLFPSPRPKRSLSESALLKALESTDWHGATTIHGLRSTFRTWAGETTAFPWEVVELCLAHQVGSGTERAYARSDLLARRARLMDNWGRYLGAEDASENVVPIRQDASSI